MDGKSRLLYISGMTSLVVLTGLLSYILVSFLVAFANGFIWVAIGEYIVEPGTVSYSAILLNALLSLVVACFVGWKVSPRFKNRLSMGS